MRRPLPVEILEFYGCPHCQSLYVIRKGTKERFEAAHGARCSKQCLHDSKTGRVENVAILGEVQN